MSDRCRIKYIYEVEFCCNKMKAWYEKHEKDFAFKDMEGILLDGKLIDECPFCHTSIDVDTSVCFYGEEEK